MSLSFPIAELRDDPETELGRKLFSGPVEFVGVKITNIKECK